MSFSKILLTYFFTSLVFFAIDLAWLGLIAKNLYEKHLGHFLSEQVNWVAALIFYFIFIGGIMFFAIYPAVQKASLHHAILYGLLFGFFTYSTYDLTNLATLKGWPVKIVVIDIVWGTLLSGLVSVSGYYIGSYIKSFS